MHPPHIASPDPFLPYLYMSFIVYAQRGVILQTSFLPGACRAAYSRLFNDVHHISGVLQNILFVVQKILI